MQTLSDKYFGAYTSALRSFEPEFITLHNCFPPDSIEKPDNLYYPAYDAIYDPDEYTELKMVFTKDKFDQDIFTRYTLEYSKDVYDIDLDENERGIFVAIRFG
jgi:hypothetical protein